MKIKILCSLIVLQGLLYATFDPVVVKTKMDALKAQLAVVDQQRAAFSTQKNLLTSTIQPYLAYGSNSTPVATSSTALNNFSVVDAPYTLIAGYSSTTFEQAYDAYFSVNAQKMVQDISTAAANLKALAAAITALNSQKTTAQNFFRESVANVPKPVFLGS